MKRKICFATGNIWRWGSINKTLDYVKKLKDDNLIDGIEITIGKVDNLKSFHINKKHYSWIKKLKYRSIHAPFGLSRKPKTKEELEKFLQMIDNIYKKADAQNIVIHPQDFPDLKFLKKYKHWNISIENMIPRTQIDHKILGKFFQYCKNKIKLKICLDAAHAYLYDDKELSKLCRKFKGKISQFHLSGTYRKKDHQSMKVVTKRFMKSIKCVFDSPEEIPIIIEEDFKNNKNFKKLVSEIKYIRGLFKDI